MIQTDGSGIAHQSSGQSTINNCLSPPINCLPSADWGEPTHTQHAHSVAHLVKACGSPLRAEKKKEAGGGRLAQEGAARWREESVNVHPVGSVRSTRIRCPIRKRLATTFEKSVVRAPLISYYCYHSNRGCGRPRSSVWTFVSGTVCLAVRFIYSLIEL